MRLLLTTQTQLNGVTVDASSQPPAALLHSILTANRFQRSLTGSVRHLLADTRYYDWVSTLREAGVTAHEGRYAQLIAWLDRPREYELVVDDHAGSQATIGWLRMQVSSEVGQ